jgi:hypothetical protein
MIYYEKITSSEIKRGEEKEKINNRT